MRNYITAYDIANQVRMAAGYHKGAFLLVEGDTDARVIEGFTDNSTCMIIVGHNKDNVLQAVDLLLKTGPPGIVAIIDSDFWSLNGTVPHRDCIFVTDSHDIETMMLQTSALEKVLRELASKPKMTRFQKTNNKTIREMLVDIGLPIGLARWISEKHSLALKFKEMDFTLFVHAKLFVVSLSQLANTIVGNTTNPSISAIDLHSKISQAQKNNLPDVWHICSGHDLMKILSIALQSAIGSRKPHEVTTQALERHFRLAYEYEFFRMSKLWKSLRNWETKNLVYKLLRD